MMAHSLAKSTWEINNYGKYINQFSPNTIKSIRQYERINKKICRQKISIIFKEICIYILSSSCHAASTDRRGKSMWVMCGFEFLPPLSLSLRIGGSSLRGRLSSLDLTPLSRNLSFIAFFSSDRINSVFLVFTAKVTDWPKNYF